VLDRFGFDSPDLPAIHDPIDIIRLVDHTDPSGPAAYDPDLAKRRAQSVEATLRAAIIARGPVPAGSLTIVAQCMP
jgi:outer membrane protein OmpA-like peptidoglycan-associated protein